MQLKQSLIIALTIFIVSIASWEFYWRSQGREPNIDDNKELWAQQMSKLETPQENQVVFIGSSRILFDFQRSIWNAQTNTDMVMLGIQGGSPLPIIKHLVENSRYRGLIVVGVAPDIFFWANEGEGFSWERPQAVLNYYKNRTYAQRINHQLSIPLQKHLAFYRDGDEQWSDDIDLATLLRNCQTDERAGPPPPPFFNNEKTDLNRNVEMSAKVTKDTILANSVIKAWGLDEWEKEIEDTKEYKKTLKDIEDKRKWVIDYFSKYAKEYVNQGGTIVLVRCPSAGKYRSLEQRDFPREQFWDSLVLNTKLPAIHFEDYPQLIGLNIPELSHLSAEDANYFTSELIKIMIKKNILKQ